MSRVYSSWADLEVESDEKLNTEGENVDLLEILSRCSEGYGSQYAPSTASSTGSSGGRHKLKNKSLSREEVLSRAQLQKLPYVEDRASSEGSSVKRTSSAGTSSSMSSVYDVATVQQEGYPAASALDGPSGDTSLHESGRCKPCMFRLSLFGCRNGENCQFCHLHHSRSRWPRPCKGKRDRIKKALAGSHDDSSQKSSQADAPSPPQGLEEPKALALTPPPAMRGEFRQCSELGAHTTPYAP